MNNPNAISAMKSGISLSFLRMHLEHNFNIPTPLVEQCLEEYYLLYWSPEYIRNQIKDGVINVTLGSKIKSFSVRYKHCHPNSMMQYTQMKLSFRSPKPEYPACNYILVMPGNEGDK